MAAAGRPGENPYAERVIRTIKEEEVYLSDYHDYHDAYRQIGRCFNRVTRVLWGDDQIASQQCSAFEMLLKEMPMSFPAGAQPSKP